MFSGRWVQFFESPPPFPIPPNPLELLSDSNADTSAHAATLLLNSENVAAEEKQNLLAAVKAKSKKDCESVRHFTPKPTQD